jgi:hypothetical protein
MDAKRRDYLFKATRGKDFRAAFKAIAELRGEHIATAPVTTASHKAKDEQRAFQERIAKIVLDNGVSGLVAAWRDLPVPEWRERLIGEIGYFLEYWAEENTLDLFICAVDDPDETVSGRAIIGLRACLEDLSQKEQRAMTKSASGKARLEAKLKLKNLVTSERRRRIAAAITTKSA